MARTSRHPCQFLISPARMRYREVEMKGRFVTIVVTIIVIAIIVSGLVYGITKPAQPSPLESMILSINEIGNGWQAEHTIVGAFDNATSELTQSYWYSNESGKFNIFISIGLFNSSESCNISFYDWYYDFFDHKNEYNFTILELGDKAIYYENNKRDIVSYGYPNCLFTRGKIICFICDMPDFWSPTYPSPVRWHKDVLLNIIELQFDKIDQYLADHPGAN